MMDAEQTLFEEISALVEPLKQINDDAVLAYTPLVDDICRRTATEHEVESTLDHLLPFAGDDRLLNLYKKVCRRYCKIYPSAIEFYIMAYLKEFDREKLVGTKYEHLLDEDEDFDELESKIKR